MEEKSCERCDLAATKSHDIILKNGDNISSRYDHLCDSCTKLAVKKRDGELAEMMNKLKSPEWNIQRNLKRLEQARGEKDISTEIRCMRDIGREEAKLGNYEKAREWISNAIELNRNLDSNRQSSMLFLLAKIEFEAKNNQKAHELFREAFSLERENRKKPRKAGVVSMNFSTALRDYGRVLIKEERWEEAEDVFKEAIEVWQHVVGQNNSKSGLLMIHGQILGKLNREREQIESFNEAVRILNEENKEIPQWLIDHLSSDK